jgi:nitrogen fixation/metabolism regulation signal transduction histidine kinase
MSEQKERAVQILLVDDSPTIRAVYGSLLKGQGYEVLEADSIASGEKVAREHLPQLMIIDFMLPDGHGDELIRNLLANQETADILMVMFSQRQDVEEQALGAGAIDLLYKGDPTDIFLRRIASLKRYINAQQMQRRIEQEVLAQENEMQMRIHDLERVRREKRFVDRLISSIPIGLLVVGGGRVITSNYWFERLFGVAPTENYSFSSLLESLQLPLAEAMECGHYSAGREQVTDDGKLLRVHCFGIDLADDEGEEVVLWMFEDITQLRRAEEKEQFAAFQSGLVEMSATILHNIGNALTGVSGALWRVEEGVQQLHKVEQAMNVAATLVEQWSEEQEQVDERLQRVGKILNLGIKQVYRQALEEIENDALKPIQVGVSHIAEIIQVQQGAARPETQLVPCDLRKVVDDVLVMQGSVLKRSAIEVVREFESGLGAPRLPRNQLLQAVNNLVKNSYEAISEIRREQEEHSGRIDIRVTALDEGKSIALCVGDNGVGLTEEQLERVLQFGYTTKEKGSGFGLHATANFVEGLGGRIALESAGHGEGSRVTLVIPLESGQES